MMHDRREFPGSTRRPPPGRSPRGLIFVLLAMCLAVLPHLTLAASFAHAPPAGSGHHAMTAGTAEALHATAPCDTAVGSRQAAAAGPPCCIIGCGLIAEAPVAARLRHPVEWSRVAPQGLPLSQGLSTEPAERPPRSEAGSI